MKDKKKLSFFFIGLALFSMFFGAGNLIFPLFIGKVAKNLCPFSILGFLITGVLLPFLGIIGMVIFKGDYKKFFSTIGEKPGFLLSAALLSVWIPLGSAPRCITLAFASINSYIPVPSLLIFSLFYCALLFFVVYKKSRMLDILGYVLTPVLLTCLGIVIFKGSFSGITFPTASGISSLQVFLQGVKEGYNTMDLIAAFFFSASIIGIIKASSGDEKSALTKAVKASIIGVATLGIVYIGLITVAASHAGILENIPKDQLMMEVAKNLLGAKVSIIAAIAIILACFTTSVALVVVYADFIQNLLPAKKRSASLALVITMGITFLMSLLGLEGITAFTEPLLQIFYPMLLGLLLWNIGKHLIKKPAILTKKVESQT
ncbi:MAG: branched-chain amino acid transporter [Chlamydiae bacterium]|nr:branched-chain amino acid transporter [Chlamydiota bacterium]